MYVALTKGFRKLLQCTMHVVNVFHSLKHCFVSTGGRRHPVYWSTW